MTENRYELVVGLETHVELKTRTKAFCRCENRYGAPPNTLVCPVCMGLPGTLPVLNRRAMELAALAGLTPEECVAVGDGDNDAGNGK